MRFKIATIAVLFFTLGFNPNCWAENSISGVREAMKNAEEMRKHIVVPRSDKPNHAAQETARIYQSPEFQEKINREIERLNNTLFSDMLKGQEKLQVSTQSREVKYLLMPDERIYVFISSSMPIATLRNYAADLDRLQDPNITMVMRGFVDGIKLIRPTLEFIQKVLIKDPGCDPSSEKCEAYHITINIDPLLFQRYGVNKVPAIVYAKGVNPVDPGLSEGIKDNAPGVAAYMVTGDVSLAYGLDKIYSERSSPQLYNVIRKLRAGFYTERGSKK